MSELLVRIDDVLARVRDDDDVRARLALIRTLAEEAEALARTDQLTGLPNRRAFEEEWSRLAAAQRRHAIVVVDGDGLKRVNDTRGHLAGDAYVRAIAARTRLVVGDRGLVARLGGDEFVVLLPDVDTRAAAEVADSLQRAVGEDASVGVATSFEEADRRMYAAKRLRRRARS